jgi:oxygen-independent coproporphyrinogen-3 oxidase
MELYLSGHDHRYAAEQILLTLFPDERPVYPENPPSGDADRAEITLSGGMASCALFRGGARFDGAADVLPYRDRIEQDRNEQRAVKLSFYRAALASGVEKPVWGALTGVKPGKLMARYLTEGWTAADFAADFDVSPDRAVLCRETALAALEAKSTLAPEDACLYVGIPFCPTRCAYCSFVSNSVEKSGELVVPYLEALSREIEQTGEDVRAAGRRIVALYVGGGTPTTLTPPQLDALCGKLSECFDLGALREYTVEAGRPDTITPEKLAVLRERGVTRVSVNPQSMSDDVLRAIGRQHTAEDVLRAVSMVRASGDFILNMDLIAGLPADTADGFDRTLDIVLGLAPENITVHTLAMKNGSRLSEYPERLPEPETVGRMLDGASRLLRAAGYAPYYLYRQKYMAGGFENVGWARKNYVNLYNICMMEELCPVLALGAGGSTKLPREDGSVVRRSNPKYPKEYIERILQHGV